MGQIPEPVGTSFSKLQEPKRKGIILEPEHETKEPSAVRRLTLEAEYEAKAPESTRKRREDSLF